MVQVFQDSHFLRLGNYPILGLIALELDGYPPIKLSKSDYRGNLLTLWVDSSFIALNNISKRYSFKYCRWCYYGK